MLEFFIDSLSLDYFDNYYSYVYYHKGTLTSTLENLTSTHILCYGAIHFTTDQKLTP